MYDSWSGSSVSELNSREAILRRLKQEDTMIRSAVARLKACYKNRKRIREAVRRNSLLSVFVV